MEIVKAHIRRHSPGLPLYLAVERALIRRFVARGGTAEEFCARLAPAFRERFGELLVAGPEGDEA